MKIKHAILAGLTLLTVACTTLFDQPPKHTPELGKTSATYLQASYSVSYEVCEDDESVHITLSCSPESSLKLINIQYADNPMQLFFTILVTTTHSDRPGTFYYIDEIPVAGRFIATRPSAENPRLFTSNKLSLYAEGTVVLGDKFQEQLKLLNDPPEAPKTIKQ